MQRSEENYKRVVVKIGSSLFYTDSNSLDMEIPGNLCAQIIGLVKAGKELIIVSSGAIALGMQVLGLKDRPKELVELQAIAAVGQNEMMNMYRLFLGKMKLNCAQILLTREDLNDRKRYLNAKNTIITILGLGATVPIINENDTVSSEEIKFGDNDQLSALVASLISADLLIMLSDVDGLLDKDKNRIALVQEITPAIKALAGSTQRKTSVGGMITKIEAAKIAVDSGIPCVIANGRRKDIIFSLLKEPQKTGTLFIPKKGLRERKRWIAFGAKTKGKIIIDDGAKRALLNQKSLLAVGVVGVSGTFASGDTVCVLDSKALEIARGIISVSSKTLEKVKGKRFQKEIIHRDDIAIL